MPENATLTPQDRKKDLLITTSIALAIAIVTAIVFAILIRISGPGAESFLREPGTLPYVTLTITNADGSLSDSIIDVYSRLYYTAEDVKTDDVLLSGVQFRTNAENGQITLDPNLLGSGRGYLAVHVVAPQGCSILEYESQGVDVQRYTYDNTVLIADLLNADPALDSVTIRIQLCKTD